MPTGNTVSPCSCSPSIYNFLPWYLFVQISNNVFTTNRAKRIINHAVVNEDPNARIIRELRAEVDALKEMLKHATVGIKIGLYIFHSPISNYSYVIINLIKTFLSLSFFTSNLTKREFKAT